MSGVLSPAYGRDYKAKREVLADLNAGRDFVLNSYRGVTYTSGPDLAMGGCLSVQVRYSSNRKVAVARLVDGVWR